MKKIIVLLWLSLGLFQVEAQNVNLILGRPTNNSITINALSDAQIDIYVEYGQQQGVYTKQIAPMSSLEGVPLEIVLNNLEPNTLYYYRIRYKRNSESEYISGDEYSFHTQRENGSVFRFTVESDPHSYDKKGNHELWDICLANQLSDGADFMIDMGDTFGDDHEAMTITNEEIQKLQLIGRDFFGRVCHSMPFYFCIGNHEGEFGYYLLQTPPNNIATYETLWRKQYFPNPYPDNFYLGNNEEEGNGIGKPQNYYAWEWGDALFVVLDLYRYASANAKPQKWDWTMGKNQYDWFKDVLEKSNAKYKFVFGHHILGQGRGGVELAKNFEWGGYDGGTYKFDTYRPDWGMPIHQLMKNNNVDIFFQGHDHIYVKQELDSIIYQTVPMPSDSSYKIGITDNGDAFKSGEQMGGSGHLRVTVSPDSVFVEFINAMLPKHENNDLKNRQVLHSYAIKKQESATMTKAMEAIANVHVFPNPCIDELSISLTNNKGKVDVGLYSIEGKLMQQRIFNNQKEIKMRLVDEKNSKLPSGIYFLRIVMDNQIINKKVVVE